MNTNVNDQKYFFSKLKLTNLCKNLTPFEGDFTIQEHKDVVMIGAFFPGSSLMVTIDLDSGAVRYTCRKHGAEGVLFPSNEQLIILDSYEQVQEYRKLTVLKSAIEEEKESRVIKRVITNSIVITMLERLIAAGVKKESEPVSLLDLESDGMVHIDFPNFTSAEQYMRLFLTSEDQLYRG